VGWNYDLLLIYSGVEPFKKYIPSSRELYEKVKAELDKILA
jgi:hypothetical protein